MTMLAEVVDAVLGIDTHRDTHEAELAVQAQFFDHFLRGQDTGILERPPVRVEVRDTLSDVVAVYGAGAWPPCESRPATLHLDATHAALDEHPAAADASVEPGAAGAQFTWRVERDADVVGPMRLRVQVSVEGEDLCLFAAVRKMRGGREVVFEGSYGFTEDVVTKGWLRATHRGVDDSRSSAWQAHHPHDARQPVPVGEVVELDLTLLPSATRFAAGDEFVLELRDHFFFPANPTTGQFPAIYQRAPRARWAVHTGPGHASTLTIPVWTPNDVPAPNG